MRCFRTRSSGNSKHLDPLLCGWTRALARTKHVLTVELVACTLESMPWVDLQYGHEYERPRLLVVRVESVAGTVLSNDPHLDGAFAVIPLSSDEDARFTGTQQVHRSAAWFAPVSGTLNELKVSVTDQTGAAFTGHWNMHFKLHLACDKLTF